MKRELVIAAVALAAGLAGLALGAYGVSRYMAALPGPTPGMMGGDRHPEPSGLPDAIVAVLCGAPQSSPPQS